MFQELILSHCLNEKQIKSTERNFLENGSGWLFLLYRIMIIRRGAFPKRKE
jgi:hypothetical protein